MNIWSSSLNGLETWISLFSLKIYSDQNLYTSFWEVLVFGKNLVESDCTIFQILPGRGGDDADKMCTRSSRGLKRKHQMRRRVQKNRKGFYKYFCMSCAGKQASSLNCEPISTLKTHSRVGGNTVFPLSIYQVLWNPPLPMVWCPKNSGSHLCELSDGPPARAHQQVRQVNSLASNK